MHPMALFVLYPDTFCVGVAICMFLSRVTSSAVSQLLLLNVYLFYNFAFRPQRGVMYY